MTSKDVWLEKLDYSCSGDWSATTKLISITAFIGRVLVEILFELKKDG